MDYLKARFENMDIPGNVPSILLFNASIRTFFRDIPCQIISNVYILFAIVYESFLLLNPEKNGCKGNHNLTS